MNFVKYLLIPVVGSIIGYITNYIAIKMLFNPKKPYRIFGFRVPFTPGVIPARRDKIASAVAKIVSKEILNEKTIEELASKHISQDFKKSVAKLLTKFFKSSLEERFGKVLPVSILVESISQKLESAIVDSLSEENLKLFVADAFRATNIESMVEERLKSFPVEKIEEIVLKLVEEELQHISIFGGILGFLIGCVQLLFLLFF